MSTSENDLPIVIVGAGLAGLNCARLLHARGERVLVIEADHRVGGRIKTDVVDGFLLDHGFQVFQTAYPEAHAALDYANLHLTRLETGAMIRHRDRWVRMADPWRQPQHALGTLFNSVRGVADRWKLFRLRSHVLSHSIEQLLATSADCTTREYLLERWKFSQSFYDLFLKPWWSGIFLESELSSSAAYFQFVFKMLASGDVALPRNGMQAIPNQLASSLPRDSIRLATRVRRISGSEVELESGQRVAAKRVVLATDATDAAQLSDDAQQMASREWSSTTCMYFAADRAPTDSKLLMLRGDSSGPVNHVFIPSNSVSNYAPEGKALISVSLVGRLPKDAAERLNVIADDSLLNADGLLRATFEQLSGWFGAQVRSWRHLRTYCIRRALPKQPAGFYSKARHAVQRADGVIVCGDYLETSSVQGALASGRHAAESIESFGTP